MFYRKTIELMRAQDNIVCALFYLCLNNTLVCYALSNLIASIFSAAGTLM